MFPTRVLDSLKYLLYPAQFVKLDQTLSLALARLAKEEEQPVNEVGQRMLIFALQHRHFCCIINIFIKHNWLRISISNRLAFVFDGFLNNLLRHQVIIACFVRTFLRDSPVLAIKAG